MNSDLTDISLVLLLNRAARAGEQRFLQRFAEAGYPELRRRHAIVFDALASGGLRAADLALRLGTTPQAVTQLIADLEASGNIMRSPDPHDGRARLIKLTERGHQALAVCHAILDEIDQEVLQTIGATTLESTREALMAYICVFKDVADA